MASWHRHILRFIAISTLGLVLGFAYWQASDLGYFQHWTQVAEKPTDLPGYLGMPGEAIQPLPPDRITSPCDFSKPEFSLATNAPTHITDCVQRLHVYADGDVRVTYVIDSAGSVWEWKLSRDPYNVALALGTSLCSGFLVGILAAFLAEGLKMYVDREEPMTARFIAAPSGLTGI